MSTESGIDSELLKLGWTLELWILLVKNKNLEAFSLE